MERPEVVEEAFEMRLRRRNLAASADEVENLEGGEEEKREKGVFDVDVDDPVEDPHHPPSDEPLEKARPHPLKVEDVEEAEGVVPEVAEMAVLRLLHRLLTRRLA